MPKEAPLPPPVPLVLWSRHLRDKQCQPVTAFDANLKALVDRLISTCYAHDGLGLAAPQIGEFVRVAVVHFPQESAAYPIINPVIDEINSKGEQVAYEACLSVPTVNRVNVHVRRCQDIVFSYQDLSGKRIEDKASGMLARVIAHEVDHLNGLFYIDRIGDLSRSLVMKSFEKYVQRLEFKPLAKGTANL